MSATGLGPIPGGAPGARRPDNSVYLSAPVGALVEGFYQQDTSIAELKTHGDFGLGTFNNLDGELVMLDGIVYQMRADGLVYPVEDAVKSPFACVTFFHAVTYDDIPEPLDAAGFNALLERLLPSRNMLYAIRVTGEFSHVRARSVPRQQNYRPLVEVAREQPVFDYRDISGTLVGFYTPAFMEKLNVPGYHMHFLSADGTRGGHLLECATRTVRCELQNIARLEVALPVTLDYLTADLSRDTSRDLEEAEH
jgi:acetolactate decarboxylase